MGAFVALDVSMRMLLTSRRRAGLISVTHGVPTPVRARRRRFFNVFAYGMSEVDKPADAFPAELQELQTSGDLHRRTELKYHFDDRKGLLPPPLPALPPFPIPLPLPSQLERVLQVCPSLPHRAYFWPLTPMELTGKFPSCSRTEPRDTYAMRAPSSTYDLYIMRLLRAQTRRFGLTAWLGMGRGPNRRGYKHSQQSS